MDEHRLKCFIAVYEEGSVSGAAIRLHMTQPPLSILLRKLEDELGVGLFDRSDRRLIPTDTGALFYMRAKAMLANFETTRRELREAEGGSRGHVHLGCSTAASLFIIPELMQHIRCSAMDITMHVHEGETIHMLQQLRVRSLDLILSRSQHVAPDLESHAIMEEPLCVALPASHRLAGRTSVAISELRDERFMLHHSPTGTGITERVLRACREAGFEPNVVYWGAETLPMLLMAEKGLGVTFSPQSFTQLGSVRLPRLIPLEAPELRTNLNLTWHRQQPLSPTARRIKEQILQRFAQ
jgi:DNA-binding transcriptional LysR family regulator